jgi:hypothetical protein
MVGMVPVAPHACPKCARAGRVLEYSSNNVVTYYRCDTCHHVWAHVHTVPNMPVRDVTGPLDNRDHPWPRK